MPTVLTRASVRMLMVSGFRSMRFYRTPDSKNPSCADSGGVLGSIGRVGQEVTGSPAGGAAVTFM